MFVLCNAMRVWFKARLGPPTNFTPRFDAIDTAAESILVKVEIVELPWVQLLDLLWSFCTYHIHIRHVQEFRIRRLPGYLLIVTQILVYINCCRECQQRRIHCWLWVKARISRMLESWKHNPPVSTGLIFSCLAESWAVFLLKRLLHISIIYQHPFRFDLATSLGKL